MSRILDIFADLGRSKAMTSQIMVEIDWRGMPIMLFWAYFC